MKLTNSFAAGHGIAGEARSPECPRNDCVTHPADRPELTQAGFLDDRALGRWASSAAPGEALEYYRGYLALDRTSSGKFGNTPARRWLDALADRALDLANRGLVYLVQRRHGPNDYSYFVVAKTSGHHPVPQGQGVTFADALTLNAEERAKRRPVQRA